MYINEFVSWKALGLTCSKREQFIVSGVLFASRIEFALRRQQLKQKVRLGMSNDFRTSYKFDQIKPITKQLVYLVIQFGKVVTFYHLEHPMHLLETRSRKHSTFCKYLPSSSQFCSRKCNVSWNFHITTNSISTTYFRRDLIGNERYSCRNRMRFKTGWFIDQPLRKEPTVIDGIVISGWPPPMLAAGVETELGINRTKTGESKYNITSAITTCTVLP